MAIIPLTKGYEAVVDEEDWDWLTDYLWHAHIMRGLVYAARSVQFAKNRWRPVTMHQIIMQCPSGFEVDHRDGDGLNNRKSNLRVSTHAQNMANTKKRADTSSKYKGVYWHKGARKWMAYVGTPPNKQYLGLFLNEDEAALAYDNAALQLFGDFARTNF